ncbi:Sedlin [Gonapodya prolifera JEL478]|uniref:Trafficking protein particle complex subunit 2-like protein n=1 Tax=Gonapodya prolifera (strain JEL478) TaxID=1344416 RepID=A0A139A426_GONPJ|nr:Sedlin [Gonapodya prolifera JEL478]|eukprot:KXS11576.1 Sedlin [Gonapodya prolifera JEL478]
MNIQCVAYIGKQNNPIFVKNLGGPENELRYHFISHVSCDIIEERTSAAVKGSTDLYLGHLSSMEDIAVYGCVTNTKIKIVVILQLADIIVKDSDMRQLFKRLHSAYANFVSNPFYLTDDGAPAGSKVIASKKFSETVENIARSHVATA